MNVIQRVQSYCKYLFTAKSHQRIHSPFVFNLLRHVFYQADEQSPAIQKIENRRNDLLQNNQTIQVTDLGAGAGKWGTSERKISDIAGNSLKRKKYAQLIYRIVHHFQPETVLEFGTSLGITTAYIGQGYTDGQVVTIEGCPNIARVAGETFDITGTKNIRSYTGNFDDVLPEVLRNHPVLDIVFIDGNHSFAPTLKYFEQTLPHAHNDTIFIFDDIHWSADMEKAWHAIQQHPRVTITIDIYEMGFVFIRNENKKPEHFVIKY